MENLSKEELKARLKELRKGKDADDGYRTPIARAMAMCYSPRFARYDVKSYKGIHLCQCCKKEFGCGLQDSIENCAKKKYAQYSSGADGSVLHWRKACFRTFVNAYRESDPDLLSYLEAHGLSVFFSTAKVFDTFDTEACRFNRKLTFEEWKTLNTDCQLNRNVYGNIVCGVPSQCFEYDRTYEAYERLVDEYREAGFDAQLIYNCETCCEEGKNDIEFRLRLRGEKDYIISYPQTGGSRMDDSLLASYTDYKTVLEFLKGTTSYSELMMSDRNERIRKVDIDKALNSVINAGIDYGKKELIRQLEAVYSERADHVLGFWQRDAALEAHMKKEKQEYITDLLSQYSDDYRFSIKEALKMIEDFDSYLRQPKGDC